MHHNNITVLASTLLGLILSQTVSAQTASPERSQEITERGKHVMSFNLGQTQHIFSKTETGGLQQVIVKDPRNSRQIELIRQHLKQISKEFAHGDFSKPEAIHGQAMPGLATLRAAKPGQLHVQYKELPDGAEIAYTAQDQSLITAIHQWFDAQLSDHGPDAVPGMHHGIEHHKHKQQLYPG